MSEIENPSAFPLPQDYSYGHQGMTLRDYFANSAMQAIITAPEDRFDLKDAADLARIAYIAADAMLIERNKDSH